MLTTIFKQIVYERRRETGLPRTDPKPETEHFSSAGETHHQISQSTGEDAICASSRLNGNREAESEESKSVEIAHDSSICLNALALIFV